VANSSAAPKVTSFFPAGVQRGQKITVTASGEFPQWPVQVWSDNAGLKISADKVKGNLQIEVAGDAMPGVAWLRMYDADGAAALRPFVIGLLPEVNEQETNDLPGKPQSVEPKVVINGRLAKPGDVDGYSIVLKAGQTLVASLQANTLLGSPMDAAMQVCELLERRTVSDAPPQQEAFVLAQNHDAIGLDPQLAFTAPHAGTYLVRLFAFPEEPNSTIAFAGGETFIYRLTLTSGPFADHALPLAVTRGAETAVQLQGWNLTGNERPLVKAAPHESEGVAFQDAVSGVIPIAVVDHPSIFAAEATSAKEPKTVELPVTISGLLATAGASDVFRFSAKKGKKIDISLESRSLGLPLDAVVTVSDTAGTVLMEVDDSAKDRDPKLVFTPPADGDFLVTVRDLSDRGGLRFAYRLTLLPLTPDYTLTLAADTFTLTADKPAEIAVTVNRQAGFDEPIEVRALELPAGVTAEIVTSAPKGDTAKAVKLVLKLAADARSPVSGPFRFAGRSTGTLALERSARFTIGGPKGLPHSAAWVTVKK